MSEIRIRTARCADIPAMTELLSDLFAIETDFLIDSSAQRKGLSALLNATEKTVVKVAVDSGRVVGMVTGQIVISTAEGGNSMLVEDLVVRPEYRGKGIGSALLAGIEQTARERECLRMQLLADRRNAKALKFYAKRNWSRTHMVTIRKSIRKEDVLMEYGCA